MYNITNSVYYILLFPFLQAIRRSIRLYSKFNILKVISLGGESFTE